MGHKIEMLINTGHIIPMLYLIAGNINPYYENTNRPAIFMSRRKNNVQSFVGFEVLRAVIMKNPIFWCITPCRPVKVNRSFGLSARAPLATCFMLGSSLAYSSTLTMEATYSSETSVDFERITRRYISKERTVHMFIIINNN
jgi:hypothetical protein